MNTSNLTPEEIVEGINEGTIPTHNVKSWSNGNFTLYEYLDSHYVLTMMQDISKERAKEIIEVYGLKKVE